MLMLLLDTMVQEQEKVDEGQDGGKKFSLSMFNEFGTKLGGYTSLSLNIS